MNDNNPEIVSPEEFNEAREWMNSATFTPEVTNAGDSATSAVNYSEVVNPEVASNPPTSVEQRLGKLASSSMLPPEQTNNYN